MIVKYREELLFTRVSAVCRCHVTCLCRCHVLADVAGSAGATCWQTLLGRQLVVRVFFPLFPRPGNDRPGAAAAADFHRNNVMSGLHVVINLILGIKRTTLILML